MTGQGAPMAGGIPSVLLMRTSGSGNTAGRREDSGSNS